MLRGACEADARWSSTASFIIRNCSGENQRFFEHLDHKYSTHGYIRLWLPNSPNTDKLKAIREIINDKNALMDIFDKLFEEEIDTYEK